MGRYTPKISLEGSAAFSDELSSSDLKAQDRYQKGYSGDDPEKIEASKLDDQADIDIATDIKELTNLTEDSGTTGFESTEIENEIDDNPFNPEPIPQTIEAGDPEAQPIDTLKDSLESIREDLEEVEVFNVSSGRSTRPTVDVYLDDVQKTKLDESVQTLIEQNPESCASLESICLCNERHVKTLKQIIDDKIESLDK